MMDVTHTKQLLTTGVAILVATVVSTSAAAQDCKPLHTFTTVKPGELTVTSVVLPPFAFDDASGAFTGVDGEIIQQIAKDNCLKVNHVVTESSAVIQYVVTARADIAVGAWYRTFERAKVLGVSDPLYLEQAGIYSRNGATTFDQLAGRKVGTVNGYLWVPDLRKLFGSHLSLYPNPVALIQDLNNGRLDAAINTYAVGIESQKRGGLHPDIVIKVATPDARVKSSVYPAQTSFLYGKTNVDLGQAINATIKTLHANGNIAALLTQYGLPADAANVGEPRFADQ